VLKKQYFSLTKSVTLLFLLADLQQVCKGILILVPIQNPKKSVQEFENDWLCLYITGTVIGKNSYFEA
jgi:hypothetical protein